MQIWVSRGQNGHRFVRKKPNKSGSVSVQVIDKSHQWYQVVQTIGSARDPDEINRLVALGEQFIRRQCTQYALFPEDQRDNAAVLDFVETLANASIRTLGPELIFGPVDTVIENYGQLWHIEKAFRISKTDLRIRPIYHRRRRRIEAHVLVAFVAYTIYKELERRLHEAGMAMSPRRVAELTQTMYEMAFKLPDNPAIRRVLLRMNAQQQQVYDLIY